MELKSKHDRLHAWAKSSSWKEGRDLLEELLAQLPCESYGTIYVFLNLLK